MPLSDADRARYRRQILLPGFGEEAQERLQASRVLVIGLGGLGSPAALYLAAAGVGTLGLADFDTVEENNLQRQILHGQSTVGRPKVESACRRLHELNSAVHLRAHPAGLHPDNILGIFREYDLVLDGSDNFSTRYLVNDAAHLTGLPLVTGSLFQGEGQVTLFHTRAGTPCYRCLFPQPPAPGEIPNCAQAGVLGAVCGVIGSLQAAEAVKFLSGWGRTCAGRLLVYDASTAAFREVRIKRDPACPLCGAAPRIRDLSPAHYPSDCTMLSWFRPSPPEPYPLQISVAEARTRLDPTAPEPALALDVREPEEVAICTLPDARLVPLRDLGHALPHLPRDRPLVVYCHHGMRSLHATRVLREHGFAKAMNLAGGIDAWARQIDPHMARY